MAKIGSEFLKEFSHYEKPSLFKSPLRLVILIVGVVLVGVASVALVFMGFPIFICYILALVIVAPLAIYGTGRDENIKEWLLRFLEVKERSYQTNYDNRKGDLTQDDFQTIGKTQENEVD